MLVFNLIAQAAPEEIFGKVTKPAGVEVFDSIAGGGDASSNAIGLIEFVSMLLKVGSGVAGIWVMFNFILAGYDYITSNGDTGAHKRVQDRLTMSIMGLVLIVTAYSIAALIGLLIFNDASYILNPQIYTPQELKTMST